MYIQPYITVVDWPEIACLMEVSTMFDIFADTAFLLSTAVINGFVYRTKIPSFHSNEVTIFSLSLSFFSALEHSKLIICIAHYETLKQLTSTTTFVLWCLLQN